MATVYLIVFAAVITIVTAGEAVLPTCLNCEICVGTIPLRAGGCTLPAALSPATVTTYETCPAPPAPPPPKLCPCIHDLDDDYAVDLVTGMEVSPSFDALGVLNRDSPNPVALFTDDCLIQAVIGTDGTVACDPIAIKSGGGITEVKGLCAGKVVPLPTEIRAGGKVKNFVSSDFGILNTCTELYFPVLRA